MHLVTSRAWTPHYARMEPQDFDFPIFKKTTIAERAGIEFRTEFFNLFNHPQFGPPNGTCAWRSERKLRTGDQYHQQPAPDSIRLKVRILGVLTCRTRLPPGPDFLPIPFSFDRVEADDVEFSCAPSLA